MPPVKKAKAAAGLPDNALAKQALETIAAIEREADQKKQAQLESLESAKAAILERMNELTHQLAQIDKAVAAITGRPAPTRERRARRDLSEVRDRVGRWMEGRKGQQFSAGDLQKEFPELEDVAVSVFMKPLIEDGKVQTDTTEGIRRMKYFVTEGG
jgi:hypothetical protein